MPYMRPWEEPPTQEGAQSVPPAEPSLPSAYGIEMGDRVQYVTGAEHPDLTGQSGVVLRTQGEDAVIQLDTGQRVMVAQSGLRKTAIHGDQEEIAKLAEQVFSVEPAETPHEQDREHAQETGQSEQAVYFGEDRDVSHEDGGDSAHTTSAVKVACSCGCDGTMPGCGCEDCPAKKDKKEAMLKGSPYPGHHDEHLKGDKQHIKGAPEKVNEIYHAIMRDSDAEKSQAAAMAWAQYKKMQSHGEEDAKVGNMNVESKWDVVALGELQQPGGVGAVQQEQHNPALDGPNMDGPNYGDNADNGFEQEVALKHWVDMAVDMLNRGEDQDLILAKLAHDGCPEPELVLQHAIEQPEKNPEDAPVTDEPLNQPLPEPANPESETAMSLPQGVQANRVKVGHVEGQRLGSYSDQWGQKMVRVALDNGQVRDLPASEVEEIAHAVQEPVEQIESFINSFPEIDEQRQSSLHRRIARINGARNKIAGLMQGHKLEERQRLALDSMDVHLLNELQQRKEQLRNFSTDADEQYLKDQPKFDIQVAEQESIGHGHKSPYFLDDEVAEQNAEVANIDFEQVISEDPAIMVSELPESDLTDLGHIHQMAASYIAGKTAGLDHNTRADISGRFVEAVFTEREKRIAEITVEPDDEPDDETPIHVNPDATDLFI